MDGSAVVAYTGAMTKSLPESLRKHMGYGGARADWAKAKATIVRAGLDARTKLGETALMLAAALDGVELVDWLVEQGAALDVVDALGRTALYHACESGGDRVEVVRRLLAAGASPSVGQSLREVARGAVAALLGGDAVASSVEAEGGDVSTLGRPGERVVVEGARWQERHARLWERLVPASGAAPTLQGELIRLTGKLTRETLDNGNMNWSAETEAAWRFVEAELAAVDAAPGDVNADVEAIITGRALLDLAKLKGALYRMSERAVRYCDEHPELVGLTGPRAYRI